jgi:voltage-gated potassium channel
MIDLSRRFWVLISVPIMLVGIGTLGYRFIETEYDLLDALYMTVITLATIGYGETHPLSDAGRIFTIFLILGGLFGFGYCYTEIVRSIVSGEVAVILGKRHMERTLAQMFGHIIVCGYGRMGRLVCKEFSRLHRPFVVIDSSEAALKDFDLPFGIPLVGDATSDEILKRAGVDRAHSMVTVMMSDADNLFATMSARLLNSRLVIVARVEDMASEAKLKRAGANRVVSPYQIGGTRMAQAVIKPTVVEFIDLTTRTEHIELQLEESLIEMESSLAGCSILDSRMHAEHRIIVVAIKKKSGHMVFNPPAETVLDAGDILIAIGSRENLATLSQLSKPKAQS